MIRSIQRTYFEIWGTEEAQNVFLKWLLLVLSTLFLIQSIAFTIICLRRPVLIAIGSENTKVFTVIPPGPELLNQELKRVVKGYIESHYTWDATTIDRSYAEASHYVGEKFVKSFLSANSEQVKIAKEKNIKQTAYVRDREMKIDSKNLTAIVPIDRILEIGGIRAITPMILEVGLEYGSRTDTNPEGVYVISEKLVSNN